MGGVEWELLIGASVPAITVVAWLLRLEGRVNTNEAVMRQAIKDIAEDVRYLRDRFDRYFNGRD